MIAAAPTLVRLVGSWTLDPGLVAVLVGSGVLYLVGARRVRGWPATRSLSFLCGLAVIALALLSGIDAYAERLLSRSHGGAHAADDGRAGPARAGAPVRLALGPAAAAVARRSRRCCTTGRWRSPPARWSA